MSAARVDLIYGPPGSAKSTYLLALATALFQRTGKLTRVYIGDGSAATYLDSGLVDAGVIHIMDYSVRDYPLTTTQQCADGWWPLDANDPQSPLKPLSPEDRAKTGMWIFEGLSVMGDYLMGGNKGGLSYQAARGIKIGQEAPYMLRDAEIGADGRYVEKTGTGEKFAGAAQSHYGTAQKEMLDRLQRSKALPGWVWWTGHEVTADDKEGGKVISVAMAGQAKSAMLPSKFGHTLHATTAMKAGGKEKVRDAHTGADVRQAGIEYRLYTREHYDPDGQTMLRYAAMTRCPLPEFVKDYYTGKPGQAILDFFADTEKAKAENVKRTLAGAGAAAPAA